MLSTNNNIKECRHITINAKWLLKFVPTMKNRKKTYEIAKNFFLIHAVQKQYHGDCKSCNGSKGRK